MRSATEPRSDFDEASGVGAAASTWFNFWSRPARIHVGDRHLHARYRVTIEEFLAAVPEPKGKRVLDYGCGEALAAPRLAGAGMDVLLYDRSPYLHQRVSARYARSPGIKVIDDDALSELPDGSVDFMLVCSVIQYLDRAELGALVRLAKRVLKSGGVLALADIIPNDLDTLSDTIDFLRYSVRYRFFFSALRTLFDMAATNYRSHLRENDLARYDMKALAELLREHGFRTSVASRNIGISRARKTILAAAAA
ncbi:MAG TPA: methyltransferase domain-containing protein [Candidatus Cybelea sp.]|nr:methyltransferase domain-containing protein [Candidatus Cybelea sp.]